MFSVNSWEGTFYLGQFGMMGEDGHVLGKFTFKDCNRPNEIGYF